MVVLVVLSGSDGALEICCDCNCDANRILLSFVSDGILHCCWAFSTTLPAAVIVSLPLVALDGEAIADDAEEGDDSVVEELATASFEHGRTAIDAVFFWFPVLVETEFAVLFCVMWFVSVNITFALSVEGFCFNTVICIGGPFGIRITGIAICALFIGGLRRW